MANTTTTMRSVRMISSPQTYNPLKWNDSVRRLWLAISPDVFNQYFQVKLPREVACWDDTGKFMVVEDTSKFNDFLSDPNGGSLSKLKWESTKIQNGRLCFLTLLFEHTVIEKTSGRCIFYHQNFCRDNFNKSFKCKRMLRSDPQALSKKQRVIMGEKMRAILTGQPIPPSPAPSPAPPTPAPTPLPTLTPTPAPPTPAPMPQIKVPQFIMAASAALALTNSQQHLDEYLDDPLELDEPIHMDLDTDDSEKTEIDSDNKEPSPPALSTTTPPMQQPITKLPFIELFKQITELPLQSQLDLLKRHN